MDMDVALITGIVTLVALITGIIGSLLGAFNTWQNWEKGRVRLKVSESVELIFADGTKIAVPLNRVKQVENVDFMREIERKKELPTQELLRIEVVNLSGFPVMLSMSHILDSGTRDVISHRCTERKYPLPFRLESREM